MTNFMAGLASSHAALGVPWRFFLPVHVLEQRGALVLRLNTRHRKLTENSHLKYIANVRYTAAVDVHHPIVMAPFACLDEGGMMLLPSCVFEFTASRLPAHLSADKGFIDPDKHNSKGLRAHNFGSHEGRRLWMHHYSMRSLEAALWKGLRQSIDDVGRGSVKTVEQMLLGVRGGDSNVNASVFDDTAWRQGRGFLSLVLFGQQ
jgi:hypothetical protein